MDQSPTSPETWLPSMINRHSSNSFLMNISHFASSDGAAGGRAESISLADLDRSNFGMQMDRMAHEELSGMWEALREGMHSTERLAAALAGPQAHWNPYRPGRGAGGGAQAKQRILNSELAEFAALIPTMSLCVSGHAVTLQQSPDAAACSPSALRPLRTAPFRRVSDPPPSEVSSPLTQNGGVHIPSADDLRGLCVTGTSVPVSATAKQEGEAAEVFAQHGAPQLVEEVLAEHHDDPSAPVDGGASDEVSQQRHQEILDKLFARVWREVVVPYYMDAQQRRQLGDQELFLRHVPPSSRLPLPLLKQERFQSNASPSLFSVDSGSIPRATSAAPSSSRDGSLAPGTAAGASAAGGAGEGLSLERLRKSRRAPRETVSSQKLPQRAQDARPKTGPVSRAGASVITEKPAVAPTPYSLAVPSSRAPPAPRHALGPLRDTSADATRKNATSSAQRRRSLKAKERGKDKDVADPVTSGSARTQLPARGTRPPARVLISSSSASSSAAQRPTSRGAVRKSPLQPLLKPLPSKPARRTARATTTSGTGSGGAARATRASAKGSRERDASPSAK